MQPNADKANLEPAAAVNNRSVVWQIGFRPFFIGAALWAVVSIFLWFGILRLGWRFGFSGLSAINWHAHEMIYGFCLAVIAGFLLTAVPNWTASKPVSGWPLVFVFSMWVITRALNLFASVEFVYVGILTSMLFFASLFIAIAIAIVKEKQARQAGILVKIILLAAADLAFYLGAIGKLENGQYYGLYIGFYLIVAIVFTIGRRVIPFFIDRRLALTEPIRNRKWIDIGSMLLLLGFMIFEVFLRDAQWVAIFACLLFLLHTVRLFDWFRLGIFSDPLLWVLYASYSFLVLGFGFKSVSLFGFNPSSFLALHLFAIGGIGLITCGMMSRVSLGHTGRNIRNAPKLVPLIFVFIISSAIVRVFFPLFAVESYLLWVSISQWLWIAGFSIFLYIYMPILTRPRPDGKRG